MKKTTCLVIVLAGLATPAWCQVCDLDLLDTASGPGTMTRPVVTGTTAHVAAGNAGIARVDIGDPEQLSVVGSTPTQGSARDMAYEYFGNLLVVADGAAGVGTYALAGDDPPSHLGTTSLGENAIFIAGGGGDFLVGTDSGTLVLVALDGSDLPQVEGQINLPGEVVDAVEHSRTVYCALGSANALAVVDTADRSSPSLVGVTNLSGPVTSVTRMGDKILAGVGGTGLVVFEVDGGELEEVGTVGLPSSPTDLVIWNERLFMAGPQLGLVEADPSLGTDIIILSVLELQGSEALALVGDRVFVGRGGNGFSSVDASDCSNSDGSLTTWFIPAGARTAGASGSFWLTDVAVANFSGGVATANLAYLPKNHDNSYPINVSLALGSGEQVMLGDVFESLFGLDSANGGLRITASHPDVKVTSRTYNAAGAEGTYGQFIPARRVANAVTTDNSGALIQLQNNDDFRTNIGLVNLAGEPVDVEIHLYAGDGSMLGVVARQLGPFEMKQIDRIFQAVTGLSVDSGYAVVKMLTTGGEVHAYASVVDNGSNDPVYIAAQPLSDTSPFM